MEQIEQQVVELLPFALGLDPDHFRGGVLSGDLRLGAIPTLAPYLLPQIVPGIRRKYANLKLYLREAKTDDLLHDLHAGEVDAVLLALPYEIGDLTVFPLFEDNYQLAIQPGHPLAGRPWLTGKDLTDIQMMLLEKGHCLQRHALSAFAPLGPHQDRTFEATSLPTLVAMVALLMTMFLGVTLLAHWLGLVPVEHASSPYASGQTSGASASVAS